MDSREAIETNRCFLIHLGIALKINPFLLKVAFQHLSAVKLRTPEIANGNTFISITFFLILLNLFYIYLI